MPAIRLRLAAIPVFFTVLALVTTGSDAFARKKYDGEGAEDGTPRPRRPGFKGDIPVLKQLTVRCRKTHDCLSTGYRATLRHNQKESPFVAKSLRRELEIRSGHEFQSAFSILLADLIDGAVESKRLGHYDQKGVDAFVLTSDDQSMRTIIQCKGFEVLDFGRDQQRQCRQEIAKFAKKGPIADEYWLAINRPIKDQVLRKELLQDLAGLVNLGKVKSAELLDQAAMLRKLDEFAAARLFSWAEAKRKEQFEFYRTRMEFVRHIDSVPFNKTEINPTVFALEKVDSFFRKLSNTQAGKHRHAPKFLVSSEFGFGKTTTLQTLAQRWIDSGRHLIFAPAALLGHRAFTNAAGLAESLLQLIMPEDADFGELALLEFRIILKDILERSKDWLVLIDGLDENANAFRANSLATLWGSIADLGIPAVLSAREELVELRHAEFHRNARLKVGPAFERIRLNDWNDTLILEFVDSYAAAQGGNIPLGYRAFRDVVASKRYSEIYGDIPKRPLFLGMLAQDAWKGKEPERYLHRLYGTYFRAKFDYDRHSLAAGGAQNRPSAIVDAFGHDQAREAMIQVMQEAADQMLEITGPPDARSAIHSDTIGEKQLRQIARRFDIPFVQLEDVAMHSLLQPSGRDPITHERLLRFAHRSFQDWFLARQFAETDREPYLGLPRPTMQFLIAMRDDLFVGKPLP
jgi:hypothetical protein